MTVLGILVVAAGAVAVACFRRRAVSRPLLRPAVTVLKPLCGDEPGLEAALASFCVQTYPEFQLVFGVQAANDAALPTVQRLRLRFPEIDIGVVVDPTLHGRNRKVSNLINMLPVAKHDLLVFSDSDLHVAPNHLDTIVAVLEQPGVGLVTTLCGGLPTVPGMAARLGATGISHCFMPSALLSRVLGRQDGLGATMALRRATLAGIGGLQAIVMHLADDNVLGSRVRRLGLRIGLADTVPLMAVPERSFAALWQHELRWARTIRALAPTLFAASVVQFPLCWAMAAMVLSGGARWSVSLFAAAWIARVAAAMSVERLPFGRSPHAAVPILLLPLRDIVSVAQVAASYFGDRVVWRGHAMQADNGR